MYIQKPPTFDAIQWDGTPEARAEIEQRYMTDMDPSFYIGTTVEDGTLIMRFQYNYKFMMPPNSWLVSDPGWGAGPRFSGWGGGRDAVTDEEFQARYAPA